MKSCPHGARYFEDDTRQFFADLKRQRITVLVTPAVKVAFQNNWEAVLGWLKAQPNVSGVYDVSFGADICTYMHLKAVKEKKVQKIISQPCAALTDYILKYRHELIPYLSPIHSPILCAAIYLRKYCDIREPLAVLSPCIAKKTEFTDTGIVTYNVVFSELKKYLAENQIQPVSSGDFVFDGIPALSGAIYPMPGGLKECLLAMDPSLKVINSEGVPVVYHNLDNYLKTSDAARPDVFDVLSCEYGCISGPGVPPGLSYFEIMNTMNGVKQNAFSRQEKQKNFLRKNKQYLKFDFQLKLEDFIRKYEPKKLNLREVSNSDLDRAFQSLYKQTREDRTIDCQACGYTSCRQMATAIARGHNFPSNCHQFVMKDNLNEQKKIEENASRTMEVQRRINELSGALTEEVSSMSERSDSIISNAQENIAAVNGLQRIIQNCQQLGGVIMDNLSQIGDINRQYIANSKMIDDIAFQIQLLSLNASVEAVRAGEAGKGFTIVAGEVGTLANKTQEATQRFEGSSKEVTQKTGTIKDDVEDIYAAINQLAAALESLKKDFEAAGAMGTDIYHISENVHAIADDIQRIVNE